MAGGGGIVGPLPEIEQDKRWGRVLANFTVIGNILYFAFEIEIENSGISEYKPAQVPSGPQHEVGSESWKVFTQSGTR